MLQAMQAQALQGGQVPQSGPLGAPKGPRFGEEAGTSRELGIGWNV